MSKLNELIQQYAPNGVEYVRLDAIVDLTMGTSPDGKTINATEGIEFHQGKSFFGDMLLLPSNTYTTSPVKLAEPDSVIMSVRAPVGDCNMTNRQIAIGRGLCAMKGKDDFITKFLYYWVNGNLQEIKSKSSGSTFESINTNDIKGLKIPLPPLPIQNEIVRILDHFSALTVELNKQLTAELVTRKKQYESYRDSLLNFGSITKNITGGGGGRKNFFEEFTLKVA